MPSLPADSPLDNAVTCPRCQLSFVPPGRHTPATLDDPPPAGPDLAPATVDSATPATLSLPGPPADAPPARIGRFLIRRLVGEGSFGKVYEADDPSLKRTVALKVAKPEQLSGEHRVQRFQREARAAAHLLHPHIVAVFDSGADGPHHYIASAFIAGRSLAAVLEEMPASQMLPLRDAAAIVRNLAEALAYAHRSGIIHRDVKPANVMLRGDGEPMLMDFGLAQRAEEAKKLTRAGEVLGTPEYMAPEQWRGEASAASDQYSLGCLLHELLTRQLPFVGRDVAQYLVQHTQVIPASPRKYRADLPRDLDSICLKCLEKEPAKRYHDCQALADDLRRWLDGEAVLVRPPGAAERLVKWARRNPAMAGLLGVVVLASVSLALLVQALDRAGREQSRHLETQVQALLSADARAVPDILAKLDEHPQEVLPLLEKVLDEPDTPLNHPRRMRAALALHRDPDVVWDLLLDWMLKVPDPAELLLIREVLLPQAAELSPELWRRLREKKTTPRERLRLLALLAAFDPGGAGWKKASEQVLEPWLSDEPLYRGGWTEALRPGRKHLLEPLKEVFGGWRLEQRRAEAASILADYAKDRPETLAELMMEADDRQFATLLPVIEKQWARARGQLLGEVKRQAGPGMSEGARQGLARRQAGAALTLLRLGEAAPVWPLLVRSEYPEARSRLIQRLSPAGVDVGVLAARLEREADVGTRQALILALGEYTEKQVPPGQRRRLEGLLLDWYRSDPDPGIHGAIDWLFRHAAEGPAPRRLDWGQRQRLERMDAELAARASKAADLRAGPRPAWHVNSSGMTFTVVPRPGEFLMGSPATEAGRRDEEKLHRRLIPRSFALATKPVTVAQWQQFLSERPKVSKVYGSQFSKEPGCPIIGISWFMAAQYCNWLSEKEGVPKDQWCYPEEIKAGMKPLPGHLARVGYRLPTEAEWEFACRAGTRTSRHYGSSAELLSRYAWYLRNSDDLAWPVGQKRPSDLGLFDMHGNAWVWCQGPNTTYQEGALVTDQEDLQEVTDTNPRLVRGGSFFDIAPVLRSASRIAHPPGFENNRGFGLRLARTCR